MYTRYALLAILLIQTLSASVVGARGSAITGRASLVPGTTFPCTLDVVLVTFSDTTVERPMSRRDCGRSTTPITSTTCSTGRVTAADQRSAAKPLLHF